jgi:hypothetical protein
MPMQDEMKITANEGYFRPTSTAPHPMPSDRPFSASFLRNLHDDATCTIRAVPPPI